MTDGFKVVTSGVGALSQSFASQKGVPEEVASALDSVSAIDTGDPSLDAETRALAAEIGVVLRAMSQVLSKTADGLSQVADDYQGADQDVASRFDQILNQGGDSADSPSESTPVG
jgi:hypothetical protein